MTTCPTVCLGLEVVVCPALALVCLYLVVVVPVCVCCSMLLLVLLLVGCGLLLLESSQLLFKALLCTLVIAQWGCYLKPYFVPW